jgi:hypothetical protein
MVAINAFQSREKWSGGKAVRREGARSRDYTTKGHRQGK